MLSVSPVLWVTWIFFFVKVRAADQTLTDRQRAEAREEAEAEGRNAKYFLKEVSSRVIGFMPTRFIMG